MKRNILLFVSLVLILTSCKQSTTPAETNPVAISDSLKHDLWAEQIESNSSLTVPEGWSEEDWKAINKNIDHEKIFNTIIDAVLSGKQKAYDFFTDSAFTIDQIKERLAEGINAKSISSIRTREQWKFNEDQFKLEKEVTRIYLFTPKLDENGDVLGDKALFYIKLDN